MPPIPDKLWLRRGEARAALGIPEDEFTKWVQNGVLEAVYFVYDVYNQQGKKIYESSQAKVQAYVATHPEAVEVLPQGRAFFRRSDVAKLAEQQSPSGLAKV